MRPILDYLCAACMAIALSTCCEPTSAAEAQTTRDSEEAQVSKSVATDTQKNPLTRSELVYELNAFYTDIDLNVPLTNDPIPTISSDSEPEIYSRLIAGSLVPRYMVLEASVYPLAVTDTYINTHSPYVYQMGQIGNTGINLFQSATADFQEPWAVSAFFGNVAKLNRPGKKQQNSDYGYTGYLFSAGNKYIKDDTLVADNWNELEWKIKGQLNDTDEKLYWSFRVGARLNANKGINDIAYINLQRSNLDLNMPFLGWLENADYNLRLHFLQQTGELVRVELILGKTIPMPQWGYSPKLDIGFVWRSPDEYSGALRDTNSNITTLIFRPSVEF